MSQGDLAPVQSSLVRLLTHGTMTGAGESQILERFLAHDDDSAFEALLTRHGPMVLATCHRILDDPHDVEDAFQATFLVLVRKAPSIRDQAVLGPWLHGVARRVAVRCRANTRRRRQRERSGMEMTTWEDRRADHSDAHELRAVIDEEVARLPEHYRRALILCDLEGQTQEQAAAQLCCAVGTVKSRLARGRDRLRSRLARRGLASSAAVVARTLAPEPASAVTAELLKSTLSAATRFSMSGGTTAGTVSAAVATLVQETLRSMSMNAFKFATALLTATGLVATGAGVLAYQAPGKAAPLPAAGADLKKAEPATNPSPETRKVEAGTETSETRSIEDLARARLRVAENILNRNQALGVEGPFADESFDFVRTSALRVLEAERDLHRDRAGQIAALERYLKTVKELEAKTRSLADSNRVLAGEYYRLEAEMWLAEAREGKDTKRPGPNLGASAGAGVRPGTDPKSQVLLSRLEETIPMRFANPTPLGDVLKYIEAATSSHGREPIQIYVDPVDFSDGENKSGDLMKSPITMDLEGVPLRRVLKFIAEQLGMGYGIKDGMVTMRPPDMRKRNWQELLVMEESFPESSPLATEVERARRGELSTAELEQLNEKMQAIEAVTRRYSEIRTVLRPGMGMMMNRPAGVTPGSPAQVGQPGGPAR